MFLPSLLPGLSVSLISVHQSLSAMHNEFHDPVPEWGEISSLIHTFISNSWSVSSLRCRCDAQLSLTGCPYIGTIPGPAIIKAPLTVIAEHSISRRRCYYRGAKTRDWLRLLTTTPPSGGSQCIKSSAFSGQTHIVIQIITYFSYLTEVRLSKAE